MMRPALTGATRFVQTKPLHSIVPEFLCPVLHEISYRCTPFRPRATSKYVSTSSRRKTSAEQAGITTGDVGDRGSFPMQSKKLLPLSCPGCGALSQRIWPDQAGYYTDNRPAVKTYLSEDEERQFTNEERIFESAMSRTDHVLMQDLGLETPLPAQQPSPVLTKAVPICDRCHNLLHHSSGVPIAHPSIESIEQTISESPYKHNHIYHVLDAADFPMSLIPNLQHRLSLTPLRTQNRRSKHRKWHQGRVAEVSFIITRADLLAPQKEQVDSLMPYLIDVLRSALGRSGDKIRLGNVRCVSAKRGWWTKHVKEDIWTRGGAGWMVGKVNVGKSNLFEVVFPKGRSTNTDRERLQLDVGRGDKSGAAQVEGFVDPSNGAESHASFGGLDDEPTNTFAEVVGGELLPPAQIETPYPVMPITSALPGTTASPIRVPFGKGKGELIDLPGLERNSLEKYVRKEYKNSLVMTHRVLPEQQSIKPRQSLLLGGLIRITPKTPDLVFLAYSFLPLSPHVTSTEKAAAIQTGEREAGIPTIGETFAGRSISSAGIFQLKWDVTKRRAGPLTSRSAVKLKAEQLPFVVYAADILIEGCGWVEVVAQMRKRRHLAAESAGEGGEEAVIYRPLQMNEAAEDPGSRFPSIEVFSPEGKFVGIRPPLNGWMLNKRPDPVHARKTRPRRSMRSMKAARRPSS